MKREAILAKDEGRDKARTPDTSEARHEPLLAEADEKTYILADGDSGS